MKKLHLILLSLVAAVPGGYLCYLLGTALALPRSDLWKKPLLGGAVVGTGLLVLLAAVVWPLLYAVAFYDDPNKNRLPEEAEDDANADDLDDDQAKASRTESFEDEDLDVFEREGGSADAEEVEEAAEDDEGEVFEADSTDSEFDLDEESAQSAETADFDLGDDAFEDLEMEEEIEEEEEAPKKKAKKKKK